MARYESNLDLAAAARLVRDHADDPAARAPGHGFAVTTHAKPDGDAIGCVLATVAALRQLGAAATGYVCPPVPTSLLTLIDDTPLVILPPGEPIPAASFYLIVDTGAWSQLEPVRGSLQHHLDHTLILDHHLSGDVPAAFKYIDGSAAACAEIIADFIDHLAQRPGLEGPDRRTGKLGTRADDWQNPLLTPTATRALFAGVASDTGWFRFSNTRPRTHELAARLLRLGVDHAALYAQLEQTERPEKLALLIRALHSLELLAGNTVALMTLRAADFEETGALLEETERFVDTPQTVETVQVVVLATETPAANGGSDAAPVTRLSFRSKPGPHAVNVAKLAERFGGGGHARAAGAKVKAPLDEVVAKVRAAVVG